MLEQSPDNDEESTDTNHTNHTSASKRSVWSDALLILQGINPNDAIPEEDDDNEDETENRILGSSLVLSKSGSSFHSAKSFPGGVDCCDNNNGNAPPPDTSERSAACIDFLQDDVRTMTYGRRIALALMKRYAWYNPRLKKKDDVEAEELPTDAMHPLLVASLQRKQKLLSPKQDDAVSFNNLALAISKSEDGPSDLLIKETQMKRLEGAYPFTHSRRERPSLEKAWAYFEHVALSRYVLVPKPHNAKKKCILTRIFRKLFCKASKLLQRAEPGERIYPTALYEPIFTPHRQLGDFGLGIGLYFSTLRAITVLTLLAGILNIPNFIYYSSNEYTPGLSNFNSTRILASVPTLLQGSAICNDVSWVVCPDCNSSTELSAAANVYFPNIRRASAFQPDAMVNVSDVFFLRNNCASPAIQTSMINYATLIFVMLGTVGLNMYLRRMEVAFDEDEQTAQDYSIVIANPPGDATDPEEWHVFFRDAFDGAHVTACTVAVDNDLLVRSLVERREKLRQIEMLVEPGTPLDTLTLAGIAAKKERERKFFGHLMALVVQGIPELFARLTVLTAKVQGLAQQDYPATNVFVTFETEQAQRQVLSAYNLGSLDIQRNHISKIREPKHLFRGQYVLNAKEPDEPNTVRWQDLNVTTKAKLKQQLLTIFATFVAIVLIAFLVYTLNNNDKSLQYTAYAIAICNSIFPGTSLGRARVRENRNRTCRRNISLLYRVLAFAKMLTDCEAHSSEGDKQRSLYIKIAVFRWVNTAIVITIITPFTSTLTNAKLINQVFNLFLAEIITSNAILFLDPLEHIKRHILAPRAVTQDAMNLKMQGAVFELAERYTNMTKILFLALWYCAIYPGALLMCALALFINYFFDRFALMRTWKRAPKLGAKISEFGRRYFFSIAILAMAVLSSYYWSAFPFDNLCVVEDATVGTNSTYGGDWIVSPLDTKLPQVPIQIPENGDLYRPCLQDFFHFPLSDKAFPFISMFQLEGQEWMTEDQELICDIFGWSSVGVVVVVVFSFLYKWYSSFLDFFRGSYEPCGEDMGINFSDVPSISSYIPEVQSPVISYPLLACHIDRIDTELLEWTDPDRPHAFYDLTKDADVLLRGTDVSSKVVFSQIAHWPPPTSKSK
jgi:hypothetical protein